MTRSGCHLCEEAAAELRAAGIAYRPLDVDSDPELVRLYDFRVPVVLRDGRVLIEGRIDRAALARVFAS